MCRKTYIFTTLMLILNLACDDKKNEITQALCARQTTRSDCEAVGCTYTCDMVLMKHGYTNHACVARRKAGRCIAMVELNIQNDINNGIDHDYKIDAHSTGWQTGELVFSSNENNELYQYVSMFKVKNPYPYSVEVLGYRAATWPADSENEDPCTLYDPDETLFPWEGSCETDWWSQDMWDDVLPE